MGYGYKSRRTSIVHDARRRNVNLGSIPPELKFFDTANIAGVNVVSPAGATLSGCEVQPSLPSAVGCLNAMAQGDGAQQRDGKHVIVRSIQIQGRIEWQAANTITAALAERYAGCFMALVWDNQCNGASIDSEDVFQQPFDGSAPELNMTPMRNPDNPSRYKILKTWTFNAPTSNIVYHDGTDAASESVRKNFRFYTKCHVPVNFAAGGTTAAVANITDKSLSLIVIGSGDGTSVPPRVQFSCRLRFVG